MTTLVAPEAVRAWRVRWLPLGAGLVAALATTLPHLAGLYAFSDFDYLWVAGRAVLAHRDPYAAVEAMGMPYPLYYPGPALVAVIPLALLPLALARAVFAGLGVGLLAYAGMKRPPLAVACLTMGCAAAVAQGQWSPLLLAGVVLPALTPLWAVKPTIGAALFVAYPSRTALWGGLGLLGVSFLLVPGWLDGWLASVARTNHVAPVLRPGGVLLLLGFLRWRLPEGRLLGALALVPHTTGHYETLYLMLCARTTRQAYALAILGFLAIVAAELAQPAGLTVEQQIAANWPYLLVGCYLPALWCVVRGTDPHREAPR